MDFSYLVLDDVCIAFHWGKRCLVMLRSYYILQILDPQILNETELQQLNTFKMEVIINSDLNPTDFDDELVCQISEQ